MQSGGSCYKQRMSLMWLHCAGGHLCAALQKLTIELVEEQRLDGGALAALTGLRALSVYETLDTDRSQVRSESPAPHGMDPHRQHQDRAREHVQHVGLRAQAKA